MYDDRGEVVWPLAYLGEDDEGNSIEWIADTIHWYVGDDDEGNPIFCEIAYGW